MKTTQIQLILALALLFVVTTATVSKATPMGTAFTYQGRLIDANDAADAVYDFNFGLYNSASDGNQVGSDVNKPDVDIIDGYFTVELDFGNVYDGNERWLEIGVRPGEMNDPNLYTWLSPRQAVRPTAYALYAKSAGSTGVRVPLALSGSTSEPIISGINSGAGAGVRGEHGPAANFGYLGSVNCGVYGKSSNGHAGYFEGKGYFSGNVGIGITNPGWALDVLGDIGATGTIYGTVNNADRVDGYHAGNLAGAVAVSNGTRCANLNADILDGFHAQNLPYIEGGGSYNFVPKFTGSDALGNSAIYETNGNVGIGMTNPALALDVSGDIGATGTIYGTVDNADRVDGYHAGNLGGEVAVSNGTRCANLNADMLDGFHASTASGAIPISNGIRCTNLDADMLDGRHAGNLPYIDGSGSYNYVPKFTGSDALGNSAIYETNGNVGIGITDPDGYRLYVNGDLKVANGNNGDMYFGSGNGRISYEQATYGGLTISCNHWQSTITLKTRDSMGDHHENVMNESGKLGLGIARPSRILDVNGLVRIRDFQTTDPAYDVQVQSDGDLVKVSSSKRYKTDITDLKVDSQEVLKLRPVRFRWKETGGQGIGLIAEEVAEAISDMVVYDDQGRPDAVRYDKAALYLLEVVKSQQQRIGALEERLEALERTNQQGQFAKVN